MGTLLRSIANGQLDGFPPPEELRTVYVEHDVQGIEDDTSIIQFVMMDPKVTAVGVTQPEAEEVLAEIGFNAKKAQGGQQISMPVTTLSGGWKMKLALAPFSPRPTSSSVTSQPTILTSTTWLG